MKRAIVLGICAIVTTASLAQGDNQAPPLDLTGRGVANNAALMAEIDAKLITAASCRSMAPIGYGNGYQCPPAGLPACMTMLKAGKVDACAQLDPGRDAPAGCGANEATSPAQRANSTCMDLSANLWNTLAVRIPFANAKSRLLAFQCTAGAGISFTCPAHTREWLCLPLQRGGVVTCNPSPPPPGPGRIQ